MNQDWAIKKSRISAGWPLILHDFTKFAAGYLQFFELRAAMICKVLDSPGEDIGGGGVESNCEM